MFKSKNVYGAYNACEIYEDGYEIHAKQIDDKSRVFFKKNVIDSLLRTCNIESVAPIIPTEFKSFDEKLNGGLRPGLYVFGANPGVGKTSFLINVMLNCAMAKKHVIYFNLDMSEQQMMTRLLSCLSYKQSINKNDVNWKIKTNNIASKLKTEELKDNNYIRDILDYYNSNLHEYITLLSRNNDEQVSDIDSVSFAIKNTKSVLGVTPVIIIDFLQQMKETQNYDENPKSYDKRLEVNSILLKLKKLSSKFQVPILIVTAVGRNNYTKDESDEEEKIIYDMGFGKESGDIEYTADFLCLMTRGKKELVFGNVDHEVVKLNILKSRFSKPNEVISMEFLPGYSYYKEVSD